ncbi:oligosaccharide flippase family protein [Candidatus Chloroploca sp. M-50]|uniref:Oligosaccharide flippase family protein n=1 Tax=Candidatus Chloroploca mongolica TaxID=2528176 RepID=A0ABS4D659_9CHLR|nr:oligosaccharide flippase family protein [Candidatus Chloroploca mongolica]MBP1464908.1 oligosaccharide flippase family protein [Candidatus Chloroploca mongolica]
MSLPSLLHRLRERVPQSLTGGAMLLVSATVVNLGNYIYNLILGRWLGPAAFADANLIVTLFLVITFVTVALQTTTAKFAAMYSASERPAASAELRRWLERGAWLSGMVGLLIFAVGAPFWQAFFHTESAWPFVMFALGVPFYFMLGVERGMLQGETRFGVLSLSYQAEMWSRLVIGIALVALGWSVLGATGGLTLSLVVAWLIARKSVPSTPSGEPLTASERTTIIRFAVPVVAALIGQILINNSDVLIVKRFFDANEAGLYAAVALIGRIVFFATWSVVTVLFPIVAQRHHRGEAHRYLLYAGLGMVLVISAPIVAATIFFPELIVGLLFGAEYLAVAPLLGGYALATTFYALSNVVISYRLSLDNGGGSMLGLAGGMAQVLALLLFHRDLNEVVLVQIYVKGGLFFALVAWDIWLLLRQHHVRPTLASGPTAD